jgi:putative membrane protein insertion efficiency factor
MNIVGPEASATYVECSPKGDKAGGSDSAGGTPTGATGTVALLKKSARIGIAQQGLLFVIRVYQFTISPVLAAALGPSGRCRFTPSCSQYAREAIGLHGAIRGGFLAGRRLCRCHPWGDFGEDPPPPAGFFKGRQRLKWWKSGHCHGS